MPRRWPRSARPTAPSSSKIRTIFTTRSCGAPASSSLAAMRPDWARASSLSSFLVWRSRPAMPGLRRAISAPGPSSGRATRSRSAICERVATATSSSSARRACSLIAAVSIASQMPGRPNSRSATTNIAAMSRSEAPSSSASSNGWSTPSRLTMRLASLVATISPRRRCSSIGFLNFFCIAGGKAAIRSGSSSGSRPRSPSSIASCNDSLEVASSTASSGRVRPRPSCARRRKSSFEPRPSTARSRRPAASRISITRTKLGTATAPSFSRNESASVWRRLSSSTRCATSSVMLASSVLRLSIFRRPSITSRLRAILMFTSLSEQSTPAELSMKSVLRRPPRSEKAMRAA
eukprot:Opistho-1_new@53988